MEFRLAYTSGMRVGLQCGGGALIGAEVLQDVKAHGFDVARFQAFQNDPPHFTLTPPAVTAALVQEVLDADLQSYVMIRRAEQIQDIPPGIDIEPGNEPDLGARFGWPSFTEYMAEMRRCIAAAEGRNPLWIGCVSNLNDRGFKFLERMNWSTIPAWVGASFHRYPDGDDPNPRKPNRDRRFRTSDHRDREVAELKRIVGARPLAISELGFHTAHGATDDDVARSMAWERAFWERHGIAMALAFQLIDGPNPKEYEQRFGFRRFTVDGSSPLGEWKPVAAAWAGRG